MRIYVALTFKLIFVNFCVAQEQLPFLDSKDSIIVFKQNGELYLSTEDLVTIDEFIILENYKLITSVKFPGQVFIYDQNNLLHDKIELKGHREPAVSGLYQMDNKAFFAARPENSHQYRIDFISGKTRVKKIKLQYESSKKVYYQKEINTPNGHLLIHFDSYGIKSNGHEIEAAVLFKKANEELDTISVIHKTSETTFLNPYKSINYQVSSIDNNKFYAIQNFREGKVIVLSESGEPINELDLKQVASDTDSKLIYGYFAGQYDYFSRVVSDDFTKSSYLYIGVSKASKSNGLIFKWNSDSKSWEKLPLKNLPFLNILAIRDSTFYFKLKNPL